MSSMPLLATMPTTTVTVCALAFICRVQIAVLLCVVYAVLVLIATDLCLNVYGAVNGVENVGFALFFCSRLVFWVVWGLCLGHV